MFKIPCRTGDAFIVGRSKKTVGDVNGTVVRLGSNGLTLIGGVEYPNNRYNVWDMDDGAEQLLLGADNNVYIETRNKL